MINKERGTAQNGRWPSALCCMDKYGSVSFQNSIGLSVQWFLELFTLYLDSTVTTRDEELYIETNRICILSWIAPILSDLSIVYLGRILHDQWRISQVAKISLYVDGGRAVPSAVVHSVDPWGKQANRSVYSALLIVVLMAKFCRELSRLWPTVISRCNSGYRSVSISELWRTLVRCVTDLWSDACSVNGFLLERPLVCFWWHSLELLLSLGDACSI